MESELESAPAILDQNEALGFEGLGFRVQGTQRSHNLYTFE